jgi:exonuclease SbcD
MAYRFLHTADIHLDSPLRSLALRNAELAELIAGATRHTLASIVDLCLAERVDALLLSGDLYDGEQTSMKTARFLAGELHRLSEGGIAVFVIRGNHDALSKITRELTFPPNVKLFAGRAEAVTVARARGERPIVVHGLSFAEPQAPESLLPRYRAPIDGAINIGLMHTSLGGAVGHDPYAPCSLADLDGSGFRYWALGHVHKASVVEGRCTVVMPGIPQGRDVNEDGAKSVALVTVADDGAIRVEHRPVGLAAFERVVVDAGGIADWEDLNRAVGAALRRTREAVSARHLVARVRIVGDTTLAWRLRRDLDLVTTEAGLHADLLGHCWIEKVELDCRAAATGATVRDDPVAELRRLITAEVESAASFRQEALGIVDELLRQLPAECRNLLGAGEGAVDAALPALIAEAADEVIARLDGEAAQSAA